MNEAIFISFSNADEARQLQIPRTRLCTGRARKFPGILNCEQFTIGRCKFSIGLIASNYCRNYSGDTKIDSRGADHFATWEATRNTPLWLRFEEHLRECHFFVIKGNSVKFGELRCSKCPATFSNMKEFFEHCFRLLEVGVFCRLCRYAFYRCHSTFYDHCRQHHKEFYDNNNCLVTNFAEHVGGGNLEVAFEDVETHNSKVVNCKKLQFSDDDDGGRGGSGLNISLPIREAAPHLHRSTDDAPPERSDIKAKLIEESSESGKLRKNLSSSNESTFWFDSSLKRFVCSRCDRLFYTKLDVKSHIWSAHVKRVCRNCSKSFNSKSPYAAHVRVCVGKSKPASVKSAVAAENSTINSVLNASLNVEGNSELQLIPKDVKPAKRAKLMSKMELPDRIKTETSLSHLYPRESFAVPGTSNSLPSGLFEKSVDVKPSKIDVNGDLSGCDLAQTSGNDFSGLPDNLKIESTSGAADEFDFAPIKTEQDDSLSSSLDFCDFTEVKVEPLDLDFEGPSISDIPRVTWDGDYLLDQTQSPAPLNLNVGAEERRGGDAGCRGIKMEDCVEDVDCADMK